MAGKVVLEFAVAELVPASGDADQSGVVAPVKESTESPRQPRVVVATGAKQERDVAGPRGPAREHTREPEREPGGAPVPPGGYGLPGRTERVAARDVKYRWGRSPRPTARPPPAAHPELR